MAGVVLGDAQEALALLRGAEKNPGGQAEGVREASIRVRPEWSAIVAAAESILGRSWGEMTERYGDWGRDGTIAVATRHLGWQLVEVILEVRGLNYSAAAHGVRRFWRKAGERAELARFTRQLTQRSLADG